MSEFDIGLGNYDTQIRNDAESDFVSFWEKQAKNLNWFSSWEKTESARQT